MRKINFVIGFFLAFLCFISIVPINVNISAQCDQTGGTIKHTNCTPKSDYNCDEQIEVLDIRADEIKEYQEHCENTHTNACTEIVQFPNQLFLFCYNQKDQPAPTNPPTDCGYLGGVCCIDQEGKNYCRPGEGGPKVSGTSCVCTVEEPTVNPTNYPTSTPQTDCVESALGCIPTDPEALIKNLFPYLLGLGGLMAFGFIVTAGIQILTSTGNPEKIQAAQELATSAITGLLFIILSLFLLRLIGVNILGLPGLK